MEIQRTTVDGDAARIALRGRRAATPRSDLRGRGRGPGLRVVRLVAATAAAAVLTLAAAACGQVTEPGDGVKGILRVGPADVSGATSSLGEDPAGEGPESVAEGSIEAPEEVGVGERFTATVTTVGLDGCWEPLDENVSVEGLTAEIVPFDSDGAEERTLCSEALVFLDHPVELAFEEPGEAILRVEGRRVAGRGEPESEPLALETTVTVVP